MAAKDLSRVKWLSPRNVLIVLRTVLLVWLTCLVTEAAALELPQIRTSPGNEVPACMKPTLLMKFVRDQNYRIDPRTRIRRRFSDLASIYRRIGPCVQSTGTSCQGVRWDFAFFQML